MKLAVEVIKAGLADRWLRIYTENGDMIYEELLFDVSKRQAWRRASKVIRKFAKAHPR